MEAGGVAVGILSCTAPPFGFILPVARCIAPRGVHGGNRDRELVLAERPALREIDHGFVVAGVVAPRRLDGGIPGLSQPLIEKPAELLLRRSLHLGLQIVGQRSRMAIFSIVFFDRREERAFADLLAEHVEDESALLIAVRVEQRHQIRLDRVDHRMVRHDAAIREHRAADRSPSRRETRCRRARHASTAPRNTSRILPTARGAASRAP